MLKSRELDPPPISCKLDRCSDVGFVEPTMNIGANEAGARSSDDAVDRCNLDFRKNDPILRRGSMPSLAGETPRRRTQPL